MEARMLEGLRLVHWKTDLRNDGVLVLSLDRADEKVNSLSRAVIDELSAVLERISLELPKGVVVRSGKPAGIPGADIKGFEAIEAKGQTEDWIRLGQLVFQRLSELKCPTVAIIHGLSLGGGTELALACRYRVASNDPSTRIGLPEVKLGIYPGWGGSVRLPQLVGAPAAMDLMPTGRTLSGSAAKAIGLVDKVVDAPMLVDAAVELATKGAHRPFNQRALAWATNWWPVRQLLAPMLARQVARKAPKTHYPAPYALIDTWRRAGGGIQSQLAAERKAVTRLAATPTARNLIRVFFLQERL